MKNIILFIITSVLMVSCGLGPEEAEVPPILFPPIVTGIIKTDEAGNILGLQGKPNENREGFNVSITGIYPNPSNSLFRLEYMHRKTGPVTIWIAPANTSNDVLQEIIGINSAIITNSINTVLVLSDIFYAGVFAMEIDMNKYFNSNYLTGYFRIYIAAEDELLWADLLCY